MDQADEVRLLRAALSKELENLIRREWRFATGDYWLAMINMFLTLGSSFLAGIGGLTGFLKPIEAASFALIPGALAVVATTMKFEPKANWHYRKLYGLSKINDRLKYRVPVDATREQIVAISEERWKLIEEMEKQWETSLGLSWGQVKQHPGGR